MDVVRSVNGVPIRLTDERWDHIAEWHGELQFEKDDVLLALAEPFAVVEGSAGECRAIRRFRRSWLVVPYRELNDSDGFIITAFLSDVDPIGSRRILWPLT